MFLFFAGLQYLLLQVYRSSIIIAGLLNSAIVFVNVRLFSRLLLFSSWWLFYCDSYSYYNYIYIIYIYIYIIYIHGIRSFDWLGYVWLRPLSLLFAHPEPCLWFRPQTSCPLASGCLCLIDKTPLSWTCSFLVSCQSCVSCFFKNVRVKYDHSCWLD